MARNITIGVTVGDINGIGPEIILNTFSDSRVISNITPVIYGSKMIFSEQKKASERYDLQFNYIRNAGEAVKKKVNLIQLWEDDFQMSPGESTKIGGKYAFKSLEAATSDLASNKIDVVVTAPINKENIQ